MFSSTEVRVVSDGQGASFVVVTTRGGVEHARILEHCKYKQLSRFCGYYCFESCACQT